MGEICVACKRECTGGFLTYQTERNGVPTIVIDSTPDRNFNVCDLCNDVMCFACSIDRDSGYCNTCYEKVSRSSVRGDVR